MREKLHNVEPLVPAHYWSSFTCSVWMELNWVELLLFQCSLASWFPVNPPPPDVRLKIPLKCCNGAWSLWICSLCVIDCMPWKPCLNSSELLFSLRFSLFLHPSPSHLFHSLLPLMRELRWFAHVVSVCSSSMTLDDGRKLGIHPAVSFYFNLQSKSETHSVLWHTKRLKAVLPGGKEPHLQQHPVKQSGVSSV